MFWSLKRGIFPRKGSINSTVLHQQYFGVAHGCNSFADSLSSPTRTLTSSTLEKIKHGCYSHIGTFLTTVAKDSRSLGYKAKKMHLPDDIHASTDLINAQNAGSHWGNGNVLILLLLHGLTEVGEQNCYCFFHFLHVMSFISWGMKSKF